VDTGQAISVDFAKFLELVVLSEVRNLKAKRGLAFLLFCRLLGNDSLSSVLAGDPIAPGIPLISFLKAASISVCHFSAFIACKNCEC
jgi:hypothetical protein